MTVPEQTIQSLMEAAEQRERQSRQRAFLYASVPIVLAIALVAFTALQIQRLGRVQSELSATENKLEMTNTQLIQSEQQIAQSEGVLDELKTDLGQTQRDYQKAVDDLEATRKELEQANRDLDETRRKAEALQERVDELEKELQDLTVQLHEATTFKRFEVSIEPEAGKEVYLFMSGDQLELFYKLLDLQYSTVRFNPTGSSFEQGFNSPNFAVSMLDSYGLLPRGYDFSQRPWQQLPHTRFPDNGDLVYYESGYTMFYFAVPEEFVIGMTPVGILTLRPDFAPILGYLDVAYP